MGSATDVGLLSSDSHGSAEGCIQSVPGCRAFGLLLLEYEGPYRMAEVASGVGLGALSGTDRCAGGAARLWGQMLAVVEVRGATSRHVASVIAFVSALRSVVPSLAISSFPGLKHGAVRVVGCKLWSETREEGCRA